MRRLFAILVAAALCVPVGASAWWQSIQQVGVSSGGFTPSCTPSSNFLARATGITLTADKTNYDTLICGLNTDGVLAKLDALYIFAAPDSTTAKLNLVQNLYNGTTTLSFSAYHGFTGATATPFNTGFVPSTATSPHYTTTSASFGVYNLTSNTTENSIVFGSFNNVNNILDLRPVVGSGNTCVMNGGSSLNFTTANSQGLTICNQTATLIGVSINGGALTTGAATPSGVDNINQFIFCRNNGSSGDNCTTDQLSEAHLGGALTNTELGNLSSRVNTFMTAYSINVY